MGHHKFVVAGVLVVCALLSSDVPVGFAQTTRKSSRTFHSDEYGYTVSLPAGWMRIPDSSVQDYHVAISGPDKAKSFRYDSAFQRQGQSRWFTWPYVIVEVIPYPGGQQPDESGIAQFLAVIAGVDVLKTAKESANPNLAKLLSNGSFGRAKWDSVTMTARVPLQMDVAGIGTVKAICDFHFGRHAVLGVACYALERNFDDQQAAFGAIGESFQFDPGFEYSEEAKAMVLKRRLATRPSPGLLEEMGPAAMPVMACGVIAILAATVAFACTLLKPSARAEGVPVLPPEQKPPGV